MASSIFHVSDARIPYSKHSNCTQVMYDDDDDDDDGNKVNKEKYCLFRMSKMKK